MARSAKQPKTVKRRGNAFQGGAVAVGSLISRNPVLVGGSTAFLVTLFYVSANALWYQPFPHAGAFFATRSIEGFPRAGAEEPETTINIVRPGSAPIKSDPVVEQIQGILKDLDFYSGTVDGISGPNTRKAIQAYQQKVGLKASGEIDSVLLDQLGATPTASTVVPHPAPRPDEVPDAARP
ncbi:MAG: peptidoglycan-binding protein, partial [Mesorhizobium sp.]